MAKLYLILIIFFCFHNFSEAEESIRTSNIGDFDHDFVLSYIPKEKIEGYKKHLSLDKNNKKINTKEFNLYYSYYLITDTKYSSSEESIEKSMRVLEKLVKFNIPQAKYLYALEKSYKFFNLDLKNRKKNIDALNEILYLYNDALSSDGRSYKGNNSDVQYRIGQLLFETGHKEKAKVFYIKSANQFHTGSINALNVSYETGLIGKFKKDELIKLIKEFIIDDGSDYESIINDEEQISIIKEKSKLDSKKHQAFLGGLYLLGEGIGINKDMKKGLCLLIDSKSNGFFEAGFMINKIMINKSVDTNVSVKYYYDKCFKKSSYFLDELLEYYYDNGFLEYDKNTIDIIKISADSGGVWSKKHVKNFIKNFEKQNINKKYPSEISKFMFHADNIVYYFVMLSMVYFVLKNLDKKENTEKEYNNLIEIKFSGIGISNIDSFKKIFIEYSSIIEGVCHVIKSETSDSNNNKPENIIEFEQNNDAVLVTIKYDKLSKTRFILTELFKRLNNDISNFEYLRKITVEYININKENQLDEPKRLEILTEMFVSKMALKEREGRIGVEL